MSVKIISYSKVESMCDISLRASLEHTWAISIASKSEFIFLKHTEQQWFQVQLVTREFDNTKIIMYLRSGEMVTERIINAVQNIPLKVRRNIWLYHAEIKECNFQIWFRAVCLRYCDHRCKLGMYYYDGDYQNRKSQLTQVTYENIILLNDLRESFDLKILLKKSKNWYISFKAFHKLRYIVLFFFFFFLHQYLDICRL